MGFGALRNLLLRPLAQKALAGGSFRQLLCSPAPSPAPEVRATIVGLGIESRLKEMMYGRESFNQRSTIHSLTDNRFPKRRPGFANRRKRASLKPPGPYAWVQYVPGEPIPRSRPNEGSVQGRNRIKRIKQHKAFIKAEAKKRKAQLQEAKRKKKMKSIERKMAAVARERAWAERLAELQKLEEEKKKSMA